MTNTDKLTLKGFLKCFKNFDFNIFSAKDDVKNIESALDSIPHLSKMLQKARKELAGAHKAHKQGKICMEELFDYEWHVHEIEQQIKNIEDLSNNQ